MYISVNKKEQAVQTANNYIKISLFIALFGAIYELFSHEVYSYHMIYAFAIPLAGGALPFLAIAMGRAKRYPGKISRSLYHAGIATLTVGSIMSGILKIYGTTNSLLSAYWIIGCLLIIGAVLMNSALGLD